MYVCTLLDSIPIHTDDTIGMAVDLWSEVTVSRADKFEIIAEGEGAEQMPKDNSNYMVVGCKAAFDAANKPMPMLKYHVVNRIPYARGLGSSSAAIVAGIIAGLILAGHRLPCWGSEALLQIAAGIEVLSSCCSPSRYYLMIVATVLIISDPLFFFLRPPTFATNRATPTTSLPSFTVAFRLEFTTAQDGSRSVSPLQQAYSLSCSFQTLSERHQTLVAF